MAANAHVLIDYTEMVGPSSRKPVSAADWFAMFLGVGPETAGAAATFSREMRPAKEVNGRLRLADFRGFAQSLIDQRRSRDRRENSHWISVD